MRILLIPDRLKAEFRTVEALWASSATTRRVDALLLSWVKYEKQLRRLFSFLVFQHPRIKEKELEAILGVMVENDRLNPRTFTRAIAGLGVKSVPELLGDDHPRLSKEVERIRGYRNKLMHGQVSGQNIKSHRLECDVILLVEWVNRLGEAAAAEFGYDGIGRNTFRAAKATARINVDQFPFESIEMFGPWLKKMSHGNG
ncbi:MAG: hypothetical protein ABMA15_28090 [Vicinamibacterales bacterium]